MLELYRWEPTLESGEVLLVLKEKQLAFIDRYVNLRAFEQHGAPFRRVNPAAQVPILVHDGRVISETGLILLYLEDTFPEHSLMPARFADQYHVHFWIKYVEERMVPYTSFLGWHRVTRPALSDAQIARAREVLRDLPPERREVWERALDADAGAQDMPFALEAVAAAIGRVEQVLSSSPWLAGQDYSLADIAVVLTVRALRAVAPEIVDAQGTPHTVAWLRRLEQRCAFKSTLALARVASPQRCFAPGPEQPRWG